jgi:hypothetical protein
MIRMIVSRGRTEDRETIESTEGMRAGEDPG